MFGPLVPKEGELVDCTLDCEPQWPLRLSRRERDTDRGTGRQSFCRSSNSFRSIPRRSLVFPQSSSFNPHLSSKVKPKNLKLSAVFYIYIDYLFDFFLLNLKIPVLTADRAAVKFQVGVLFVRSFVPVFVFILRRRVSTRLLALLQNAFLN